MVLAVRILGLTSTEDQNQAFETLNYYSDAFEDTLTFWLTRKGFLNVQRLTQYGLAYSTIQLSL